MKVQVVCKWCGKEYLCYPSKIRKHCSYACLYNSMRIISPHPCDTCGVITKNKRFCSIQCNGINHQQPDPKILHICPYCKKEFYALLRYTYCSVSCARKSYYQQGGVPWNKGKQGVQKGWNVGLTKETHPGLLSVSMHMKGNNYTLGRYRTEEEKEQICNTWRQRILNGYQVSSFSSGKCSYYWNKYMSREVYLRSSYELRFATYLDDNNIIWFYEDKRFPLLDDSIYIPDFYLPETNEWFETKGWWSERAVKKHILFSLGYRDEYLRIIDKNVLDLLGTGFHLKDNIVMSAITTASIGFPTVLEVRIAPPKKQNSKRKIT